MTCSLCETGLNFRCHIISPQTPSGQILGGPGEIIIFVPQTKKFVFGRFLGGNKFLLVPLNIEVCVWGDFQGELISVSPPNIEIGVRDDLDYSSGESLLVRRDLT